MSQRNQLLKVLYIAGAGRSGSTLLSKILGQLDNFTNVGEMTRYVWARGCNKNQLCECGQPFQNCGFWTAVFDEAYGGLEHIDGKEMEALRLSVDRMRFVPQILSPFRSSMYQDKFTTYTNTLLQLYRGIQKVTKCSVIVDTSKDPSPAYLLSSLESVNLYLVHLVRDSRAVAFSWLRKKAIPEQTASLGQFSPLQSSWGWLKINSCLEPLKYLNRKYLLLRYEDFAANPKTTLSEIISFLQEENSSLPFLDERTIKVEPNHTVSGNPIRFNKGIVEVRLDDEWLYSMGYEQKLVTWLTWPLLLKYWYL